MEISVQSPFPPQYWPRVWSWVEEFRHLVADDFAPKTVGEFVDQRLADNSLTWGVYRDGDLGGLISFQPWSPWVGAAHCIFRRDFWGAAVTDVAVKDWMQQVWAAGFGKVVMYPFRRNGQVKALLHRIGAEKEGILRNQTLCSGKPVDMVAYALFREVETNADRNDSAGHQRGAGDRRLCCVGQEQDQHNHHDAHTLG